MSSNATSVVLGSARNRGMAGGVNGDATTTKLGRTRSEAWLDASTKHKACVFA